uniref:Cytochrome P450 4c21 n=2 Tax=Lygus hesperus TaxID=30085 RepID=A0A0A9XQ54_LYGHE
MIPLSVCLFTTIAILAVAVCSTFFKPSVRQLKLLHQLPGPFRIPIIGIAYDLAFMKYGEILNYLKRTAIEGYERVCSAWLIGLPMVFLNSPPDVEVLLSSMKHIDKGVEYTPMKPWLQEGLLTSTGKKWHSRRKLLTPTFHFKILEDKTQTMFANARRFVEKLLSQNGKPFDPMKKISRCTLDVISEAAMGVSLNSQDDQSSDYVAAIDRMTKVVAYRTLNLYLHRQWLWELTPMGAGNVRDIKLLHAFTGKIIAERREVYSKRATDDSTDEDIGQKKRKAFLDRLLALDMNNSDVREEVDTFLFEGHDTTAACIEFALFELGHNPDIQEIAYKEQYEIFGNDPREATLADLQKMNYLERVIKECLRLYPSVPYISRTIHEDLHLKNIPTIPAGSNVIVMPFYIHRNPLYFPDPEKFDPDRFLPDECAKRHPFAYIPFSAGPRNCIGQKFAILEIKVILSTVLRFVLIESVTSKNDIRLAPVAILRPVEPLNIIVTPRNNVKFQ